MNPYQLTAVAVMALPALAVLWALGYALWRLHNSPKIDSDEWDSELPEFDDPYGADGEDELTK